MNAKDEFINKFNPELSEDERKKLPKITRGTDTDEEKVFMTIPYIMEGKVMSIYKIHQPKEVKERFKNYKDCRHITKTKYLWHGSKTENWLSIIADGLKMSYAADGKHGKGLYFGLAPNKSMGYVTRVDNKDTDTVFIGLFKTAYGNPCFNPVKDEIDKDVYDCAHEKGDDKTTEIVFYDDDAVILEYVVEFEPL